MAKFENKEEFVPIAHQRLLDDRYVVIDKYTGEVIEEGKDGKGYETPDEALKVFNEKK